MKMYVYSQVSALNIYIKSFNGLQATIQGEGKHNE